MSRLRKLAGSLFLGVAVFLSGCVDSPTAPIVEPDEPSYGLLGGIGGLLGGSGGSDGDQVSVLERSRPLDEDIVVTRTIGRSGGVIRLPEAGLTVIVPRWALRQSTEITVTAPAGNLVGYHFEPHGLEFRRPLTLMQRMSLGDVLDLGSMSAVYFDGELEPQVTALETLTLWLFRSLGIFRIDHFSGYVIATD